jgi:MtN3 and saliva related transmembrane protein
MVFSEFIGFLAGFFNTITFVPQVYKTWKVKSANDVSMQMFIISTMNSSLWVTYGIMIDKPAIYMTNIVVSVLSIIQIVLKVKYDRVDKK